MKETKWIEVRLKEIGLKKKDLASALGIEASRLSEILAGKRKIQASEALPLAKVLRLDPKRVLAVISGKETPDSINQPLEIPLVGRVGAGAEVTCDIDDPRETVPAPPNYKPGTVAVSVVGDSMLPLIRDSSLLYYSAQKPPEELVGELCVVQCDDAQKRVYVKVLKRGSDKGLYRLVSLNMSVEEIENIPVEWAAKIDWIKP